MSDVSGTVKVTADAHLHINQLLSLINGPLNDTLSQITSHGLALTDQTIWSGPAASLFAGSVWPELQNQLGTVTSALSGLQSQVSGVLNSITAAGSSPLSGLPVVSSLPISNL
ncbi:MAG TPA: hypothetical protein VL551_04975 [Actinospica sp.]|jgi:hypothetical protein|nr:hypothetical protein [Actinospica sp.]